MTPPLTLRTADATSALSAEHWWELAAMRRLLHGQTATVLGHSAGPDPATPFFAFLGADVSPAYGPAFRIVRRFFVQLGSQAILSLDLATGSGAIAWRLEGQANPRLVHRAILPKKVEKPGEDHVFLNVLHSPTVAVESILSTDLAGARLGQIVVLFHTETGMARSSVFFEVEAKGKLRFLITGLSPGVWEVWRDGYLEENARIVAPQAGTLFFESEAGNYFLRQP